MLLRIGYKMYKLINLSDKNHIAYHESMQLVTLWQMLDNPEFKYKDMVIVKDNNIIAGKSKAFDKAGRMGYKI